MHDKILLTEFGENLPGHLSRVIPLHPGQHVLPGLVVWSHQIDIVDPVVLEVFAHRFGSLVVVPRCGEEVGAAIFSGHRRPAGIGADQDLLRARVQLAPLLRLLAGEVQIQMEQAMFKWSGLI